MLPAASTNTDIFNPLIPSGRNSECWNLVFPLQIKPVKGNLKLVCVFLFLTFYSYF